MIRQIAYRRAGLGATLLTLVATLAACGGDAAAPARSNAELFKAGVANMKALKSYRLDANITQGTDKITMAGDIDTATKNMSLDMSAAGQSVKMVVVGADGFMSMDGGKTFIKSPGADVAKGFDSFSTLWDEMKPEDIDKAKDALKDGSPATEKIDGVDVKHITANSKDLSSLNAGSDLSEGTIDLWISTGATPYIHRMKMVGKSQGKDMDATMNWSKFNEKFDIKAPPTQ